MSGPYGQAFKTRRLRTRIFYYLLSLIYYLKNYQ